MNKDKLIDLIKKQPCSDDYIFELDGEIWVSTDWLVGSFAGRAFVSKTLEESVELLIDYFNSENGTESFVGRLVKKSGWPNLDKVEIYLNLRQSN